ncbi:MAG: AraC family transcriptional regulator [Simkaniaceae bacterium]|nr:AraC family transcriptional regulator [Simkaniaceae bacterium]
MEKDATKLDHLRRLLRVLLFIERHLDEELSLEQLSRVGSFSMYHFHRIFHGVIGETPGAYVRRLRLEQAAGQLVYSDVRITDVAFDASYETPSAFNKAFKKLMGCSPAQYRDRAPVNYKIEEGLVMQPTIHVLKDQSVFSVRKMGSYPKSAPEAWKSLGVFLSESGYTRSGRRYFGIYHDNPDITAEENIRSEACCTISGGEIESGEIVKRVIDGGRYATFKHEGPLEELDITFDRIFGNWYPGSGEKLASRPCLVELKEYPESGAEAYAGVVVHIPLES